MPNSYIVMGILAVVCIILSLRWLRNANYKGNQLEYYCKYNELTKCYETCCNYCLVKSECDMCCGGNCKACGGLVLKKKAESK